MIKYKLSCKECKKNFDSWFSSSKEYEKLKKMKLINCNYCNSLQVTKSLMAPNVLNNLNESSRKELDKLKILKKLKTTKILLKNLDYVGENFSYEARSIHYNSKKNQEEYMVKPQKKRLKN